jgi:hypothetical protein
VLGATVSGSVLDDADDDDTAESGADTTERSPAVAHPASNTARSSKPPVEQERSITETYCELGPCQSLSLDEAFRVLEAIEDDRLALRERRAAPGLRDPTCEP